MTSGMPEYWNAIAADQKKTALPDKFECRDCKKMKSPLQFSNRELNNFRWKKANDSKINGVSVKLRCRVCTGEQITELQCTGPCGFWKSLDEFSRAQRRVSGIAWCDRCTQWKEANEPSVTPMPAPNTTVAPDEESDVLGTNLQIYADDIEGSSDSDDDCEIGIDVYAYKTMSSLNISAEADTYSIPRIRHQQSNQPAIRSTQNSFLNAPYGARTEIPEEIAMGGMQESLRTASSKNENFKALSGSLGEDWNVVEGRRPAPGIAYNAWDSSGEMHAQVRAPSVTISSASNSAQSNSKATTDFSSRGAWAKPIGTRLPAKQFPMARRPIMQTRDTGDEEDSPDEL